MPTNALKLLLVEDDPDDAYLIREALAESGEASNFDLVHVQRLDEAIEHLGRESFDAIVLDLSLPDCTGLDTLHRVEDQTSKVPIVVLTGLGDQTAAIQAVDAGAQDYILKDQLSGQLLVRAIRYAVERHRLRVRLAEQALGLYISEALFRNIIDSCSDGMLVVDSLGKVVFINPAAAEILGRRPEDLLGEEWGAPVETEPVEALTFERPGGQKLMVDQRVADVEWAGEPAHLVILHRMSEQDRN